MWTWNMRYDRSVFRWLYVIGGIAAASATIAVGCGLDLTTETTAGDADHEAGGGGGGTHVVDGAVIEADGRVINQDGSDADIETGPPPTTTACTLDGGVVGAKCGAAACIDLTRDIAHCGTCTNACASLFTCESSACVDVASTLTPLRVELPCVGSGPTNYCQTGTITKTSPTTAKPLGGTPNKTYALTIRVRGVVEEKTYDGTTGGTATGPQNPKLFALNGTPDTGHWNDYSLLLSNPTVSYRLNNGSSGNDYCDPIDYTVTINALAGASLTLRAISSDDNSAENRTNSGDPIIVAGVPPAPNKFDGQFVQVDILNVAPTN